LAVEKQLNPNKMITKKTELLKALLNGHCLTVRNCMILCGTYKISARVAELEQQYDFRAERKWLESESRYGSKERYMEYSIKMEDRERIKKLAKIQNEE
jgi:hypothetical protein